MSGQHLQDYRVYLCSLSPSGWEIWRDHERIGRLMTRFQRANIEHPARRYNVDLGFRGN